MATLSTQLGLRYQQSGIANAVRKWRTEHHSDLGGRQQRRHWSGRLAAEWQSLLRVRRVPEQAVEHPVAQECFHPPNDGSTLPATNIGKVTNKGYEFRVGYNGQAGDLKYNVSVNGGYAKNQITFWDETPGAPEWQRSTGKPIPSNVNDPNQQTVRSCISTTAFFLPRLILMTTSWITVVWVPACCAPAT